MTQVCPATLDPRWRRAWRILRGMHRRPTWAALASLVVLLGCGGEVRSAGDAAAVDASAPDAPCVLSAQSYATTCQADQGCVGVFLGDACNSPCYCPTAAIASTDLSRYRDDFAATNHGSSTCFCPAVFVHCCLGACQLGACK